MDITLDVTHSLTSDEFEWEKEYVTYYMPMFNPHLDDDGSTIIYYCDSNDHCAKWPTRNVRQTTGKYLKSQKVLKQKQVHGVLDDLGA
jgi:excinuclease UvrABC nuclease subunit